jgi:hypothetical protein
MNTENVSGDQKRDWMRKLLPLFALIVGLGVPVYAHAASEEECTYCHNSCTSAHDNRTQQCFLEYGYYTPGWVTCFQASGAIYMACHDYCQHAGGPCVE